METSNRHGTSQHRFGYDAGVNEHEAAVRATGRKVARHDREKAEHVAAVVAALKAGERPTDVADWSPFTATYLRRLAREAGVPRAPKGGRRKPKES
jgi:hypothetical protein